MIVERDLELVVNVMNTRESILWEWKSMLVDIIDLASTCESYQFVNTRIELLLPICGSPICPCGTPEFTNYSTPSTYLTMPKMTWH